MPTDKPSEADRVLVRRLRRAGLVGMSETRLQRWQKAGLMVSAEQIRVPGRRGSSSVYPEGAFEQSLALGRILKRHRSFDKAAALLFARGYPVELGTLRQALEAGLDYVDRKMKQHAGSAQGPDLVAREVAKGIVSESLKTKEERAFRRQQLAQAGGEEQLIRSYATLVSLYTGAPTSVVGLLIPYQRLGSNLGPAVGFNSEVASKVETGIHSVLAEVRSEGGLGALLRSALPEMELERFEALRDFAREAFGFLAALGFWFELPSSFLADLYAALLKPDSVRPQATENDGVQGNGDAEQP